MWEDAHKDEITHGNFHVLIVLKQNGDYQMGSQVEILQTFGLFGDRSEYKWVRNVTGLSWTVTLWHAAPGPPICCKNVMQPTTCFYCMRSKWCRDWTAITNAVSREGSSWCELCIPLQTQPRKKQVLDIWTSGTSCSNCQWHGYEIGKKLKIIQV